MPQRQVTFEIDWLLPALGVHDGFTQADMSCVKTEDSRTTHRIPDKDYSQAPTQVFVKVQSPLGFPETGNSGSSSYRCHGMCIPLLRGFASLRDTSEQFS